MSQRRPSAQAVDRTPPLNLHLQQLRYLREWHRRGGVTAAAAALHVSQPALSQSLGEMENRLGLALFEYQGRKRRLTAIGREVLAFAEEVLAKADDLHRRLEGRRRGERGELRVGMIDAASLYVLPQVVRRYKQERPEVELSLTVAPSRQLLAALRRYQLDLVFAVGPLQDEAFQAETVRRESLVVYAPPDTHGRDPRRAEWVLYPPDSRTRALIDAAFERKGIHPRIALESGSPEVMRQLVALGLGWSVLPEAVAAGAPVPLRRVWKTPLTHRELLAYRRRGAPSDPLAEAFLERARQA